MKDIAYLLNRIKSVEPKKRTIYDPKQVVQVMQVINPSWVCGELELHAVNWMVNSDKWILLQGNLGTGKSMLIDLYCKAIYTIEKRRVAQYTTDELCYHHKRNSDLLMELSNTEVCLDELGVESETVNTYGTKSDPVSELIRMKYHKKTRLIMATNLTNEQIFSRYGDRIADRFREMCHVIVFKGESKR